MRTLLVLLVIGLGLLPGPARAQQGTVVGDYFKLMVIRCLSDSVTDVQTDTGPTEVRFTISDAQFLLSRDAYWPHFDGPVFTSSPELPALGLRGTIGQGDTWQAEALGIGCYYLAAKELHP